MLYTEQADGSFVRVSDGAAIPEALGNRDYEQLLADVAADPSCVTKLAVPTPAP